MKQPINIFSFLSGSSKLHVLSFVSEEEPSRRCSDSQDQLNGGPPLINAIEQKCLSSVLEEPLEEPPRKALLKPPSETPGT